MSALITVENLSHHFGARPALEQLSFQVNSGEVFALLGPNGAGKTTTVRLLNGLYHPSAGQMTVLGLDPTHQGAQVRCLTGVLTEMPALYERLNAAQNLEFFAVLAGMPQPQRTARIHELLDFFELSDRAGERVGGFSKGMKQRLALARALLTHPPLLFLDEPTSGLDPEAAQQVHTLIDNLRRQDGHTIILCTHNLFEAERLCDRFGVMNHGRMLACGSLEELRRQVKPEHRVRLTFWRPLPSSAAIACGALPGVVQLEAQPQSLHVQIEDESVVPALVATLVQNGAQVLSVQPQQVSLEDIYFTLQEGVA